MIYVYLNTIDSVYTVYVVIQYFGVLKHDTTICPLHDLSIETRRRLRHIEYLKYVRLVLDKKS